MKKLLQFLDEKLLKFGVSFAIIFTALYPKLPSIHISHTWVYIRLEDFVIASLAVIWVTLVLRKKIRLPFQISFPFIFYWLAGLITLVYSMIFIGPHLANYFPTVAALSYFRRIEYMILFFIALSTVKSEKDIKDYVVVLMVTLSGVILYGFGQRWYIFLWSLFPHFFEKFAFCFPSFQTGNEEFAKGIPLCLPPDARITSTYGGHYDLAGFLVLAIPVLFGAVFAFKKIWSKIFTSVLILGSVVLLILTASRISFIAYLVGVTCLFVFIRKKKFILPVILLSTILLFTFSASTAKRFLQTFHVVSVVTNSEGAVVGLATNSLPKDLQGKISANPLIVPNQVDQNLPHGTGYLIGLGQAGNPVNSAVVQKSLSLDQQRLLKLANGGFEISTISGTFLVKTALVYDISFTTRFQGEWPNAWHAFTNSPLIGSGFATITLATDSDYFRVLGESGILGLLSFSLIFMYLGILLRAAGAKLSSPLSKVVVYGLAGGVIGLFVNASFIDVFEASKIAEPLWMLLGIGAGVLLLVHKEKIPYFSSLKKIFSSNPLIAIYSFSILGIVFFSSLSNFFVADDFTWLRWAGSSTLHDLIGYFTNAQGFFYRPLDKIVMLFLFSISAFKPEGFHLFMLLNHLVISFGVFILLMQLFGKRSLAFFGSLLFIVLPVHGENVYWISTISNNLSAFFIVYGLLLWNRYRRSTNILFYILTYVFVLFSFLSYEGSLIFPLLLLATDLLLYKVKFAKKVLIEYSLLFVLIALYFVVRRFVNVVPLGGDYAYNAYHLIPNIFGNFLGYIGLFITGEPFFPIYTALRMEMRQYWLEVFIGCVIAIGIISFIALRAKEKFRKIKQNDLFIKSVYGIIFAVITLIPFLGLGNISERYFYVGTIGIIITCIAIIVWVLDAVKKQFGKKVASISFLIFSILVISIFGYMTKQESTQWYDAGIITQDTLADLKANYPDANALNKMYFSNIPIRRGNAWVFPVGLDDAIWFVYRDKLPKIYKLQTTADALELQKSVGEGYILEFDKNGMLHRIIKQAQTQ